MKRIAILPLAIFFLSAGVVKSQAPLTGKVLANLQDMITANKTLIDKQQKTLDALDQVNQDAQQLKVFAKRG